MHFIGSGEGTCPLSDSSRQTRGPQGQTAGVMCSDLGAERHRPPETAVVTAGGVTGQSLHARRRLSHTPAFFPSCASDPPSRQARASSPSYRGEKPACGEVRSSSQGPDAGQRWGHGADSGSVSPWPGLEALNQDGLWAVCGPSARYGHRGPSRGASFLPHGRTQETAPEHHRHLPSRKSRFRSVETKHQWDGDQAPGPGCGDVAGGLVNGEEATPAGGLVLGSWRPVLTALPPASSLPRSLWAGRTPRVRRAG